MAEEQDILAQLEEDVPEAKSSSKKWILIFLLLAVLGGGGYFVYLQFMVVQPQVDQEAQQKVGEKEAMKEEAPVLGTMYSMEPFIVNLAGSEGKRLLKVTISLELSSPDVNVEVQENIQKIVDSTLVLLSSKTFEEVYSVQGKFKLKDEIATRVNRFLVTGHIKDVYFTEFVIQ